MEARAETTTLKQGITGELTAADLLWVEAEAVGAGGHLVTVNDAAEEAWLREAFGIRTSGPPFAWIGFTSDGGPDGKWTWVAGDGGYWRHGDPASTSYVNWCPGEPKDCGPALMGWGCEGYGWNDWGDPSRAHGIIERTAAL